MTKSAIHGMTDPLRLRRFPPNAKSKSAFRGREEENYE